MAQDKEARICEKLVDLMEETSFFDIKVKDFTDYAGISRSTFYRYFDSMYDVLQKIEDDFLSGLVSESDSVQMRLTRKAGKIDSVFASKVTYIEENKRVLRVLLGQNGDPSFSARLINRYKRNVRKTLAQSCEVDPMEIEIVAEFVSVGSLQVLRWWLDHEHDVELCDIMLSLERYVDAIYATVRQA